jgi:predicted PurR-regulated permease PerM
MASDPQVPINPAPTVSPSDRASLQTAGIGILAFIASCAALYFGREVLVPIAFAVLLQALFRPIVRVLEKLRLPTTVGAAVVVLTLLALLTVAGISLAGPIQRWVKNIPEQFQAAQSKFEKYRKPLQQINSVATQIEHAAQSPTTAPAAPSASAATGPSLLLRMMGGTTQIFAKLAEVLLLLFLLLSTGDLFLQKLVKVIPLWRDKKDAIQIVQESQSVVMHYILLNAIVMACQGVVVSLVLWAMGMPSPWLWGIFSFLLELIPYIGAAAMIILLAIASFATFDGIGHILLIPASYLVITTIQSSVISPFAYGKRLKLNPVAVFVGVLFWFFLWGVPGAYLAVPIIALIKIIADRTESFAAIGEFLGE